MRVARSESRAVACLLAAAALTAAGLALAATVARSTGAACVALGWLLLAVSLHAFGGTGT